MLRNTYRLSVILILILSASAAYAAYDDHDNPPDLFCQQGKTAGNNPAFGGKPISLLSGMETFAPSTDLTLGTLFPIRITRSYNSRTSYDSPLGYGWAINYDKRLYTYPDNSITVRRDCGGKKRFSWAGPGYIGQTGDTGTLVLNAADGSFTYTDKYGETEKYDAQGRLMSMADAKGNSLFFTYTSTLREFLKGLLPFNLDQNKTDYIVAYDYHLSKIEEKDASGILTGKYVDLHYDSSTGRLTDITDGIRTISYGHDTIGNLITASGPSTNSTYGYTDGTRKHLLTSIDEGNGAYINIYDTTARVTKQTHGTGEINFAYTVPYQKTTMTTLIKDNSNNLLNTQTRTVEFDSNGMPIKVTDTNGNITTYVRDNNTTWILQEAHKDIASGVTTTTAYTYDTKGNTLTKTDALGTAVEKTTTYTYDPVFSTVLTEIVQSVVDPAQNRTTTNTYYNATSNLQTATEQGLFGDGTPYTYTTTYAYYPNGKLQSIDGPRTDVSDITTYTYDSTAGYLTSMTQPIIGTTTYSNFDALGNPQTVTDPNGNVTTYTYDTIGRVASVKAAGDTAATQYFYISGGCQSCGGGNKIDHITLPEGNSIWYTYDTLGNLSAIKDDQNNSINYTYDSEGNKLAEQIKDSGSNLQKSLSYSYDALNRLSKITNPDTNYTQYTYDGFGNRKSVKDPNGNTTTYAYDSLNRLATVTPPGTVTTLYGYNSNSNLATVKDANNNTTTYKMDDKGRVYQVISPDTGTTTYGYDPSGNMISKTDAKTVMISYVYDALNRLTNISADTGLVYSYDTCVNGKGRLCGMTDASGTTAYEYTAKGQIKKETKVINSVQYVTQYSYDMNGNLKTMTYPSGRVITYNYSSDHAVSVLNNAVSLATNINYKAFGGISSITYGNGIVGTIGYDNQYRITSIAAGAVMNLSYNQYDANANIQHITNALDPTKNKTFGYDALDRLTSGTGSWGSLGWTYDGVGNRQTENSNSYTYFSNTNKLNSANGKSFGYDNNGNATTESARQYIYNQNQRLIQVNDGATTSYYIYNGNGQRAKKVVNGVTTIFHYSLSGQIIAESNSSGNITAEYVYLNGQPLAKMEGTSTYYYHNDHLGTPQKMTDSTGVVKWAADYKPFGEATVDPSSTITNNLRFPGQYFDQETGLNYNYYRDYNPVIGRYLTWDPVLMVTGEPRIPYLLKFILDEPLKLNPYLYVLANPVNNVDILGLACGSGWSNAVVPDNMFGWYSFEGPCTNHDKCYDKCGASKSSCDDGLLKDALNVCSKLKPNSYWKNHCEGSAYIYYSAVRDKGQGSYDNAQKAACKCKK